MAKFGISSKGNRVIELHGYRFVRNKTKGDKIFWECNKRKRGCKATLCTVHDKIIKVNYSHDHGDQIMPPSPGSRKCCT